MRPRYLVTNGCSCTRGEELTDPESQAWPYLLAKLVDAKPVNLAMDGASNRRIVRSSIQLLPRLLTQLDCDPADLLVLTCWTELSRHEYYSQEEEPESRGHPDVSDRDEGWHRIGIWRYRARHRPSRAFYRHLWTEQGQAVNFCTDWIALDAYLQRLGVSRRYLFAFPPPQLSSPVLQPFVSQLPLKDVLGVGANGQAMAFIDLVDHLPKGKGGHPLAEGHKWYAEAVAGWLDVRCQFPR
ncbi:DUF6071 family protein [Agromyces sp. CCNWLW208]|uniref:DUF6071 family protein n=1 Tax=unclassified Agromyces TaxID=2639701 RepID=UPI003FA5D2DB